MWKGVVGQGICLEGEMEITRSSVILPAVLPACYSDHVDCFGSCLHLAWACSGVTVGVVACARLDGTSNASPPNRCLCYIVVTINC